MRKKLAALLAILAMLFAASAPADGMVFRSSGERTDITGTLEVALFGEEGWISLSDGDGARQGLQFRPERDGVTLGRYGQSPLFFPWETLESLSGGIPSILDVLASGALSEALACAHPAGESFRGFPLFRQMSRENMSAILDCAQIAEESDRDLSGIPVSAYLFTMDDESTARYICALFGNDASFRDLAGALKAADAPYAMEDGACGYLGGRLSEDAPVRAEGVFYQGKDGAYLCVDAQITVETEAGEILIDLFAQSAEPGQLDLSASVYDAELSHQVDMDYHALQEDSARSSSFSMTASRFSVGGDYQSITCQIDSAETADSSSLSGKLSLVDFAGGAYEDEMELAARCAGGGEATLSVKTGDKELLLDGFINAADDRPEDWISDAEPIRIEPDDADTARDLLREIAEEWKAALPGWFGDDSAS